MERHEILEESERDQHQLHARQFRRDCRQGDSPRDEIYPPRQSEQGRADKHRQARSISYRMGGAKLPVLKDLDRVFADTPSMKASGASSPPAPSDAKRNTNFIGGHRHRTKTHLCIWRSLGSHSAPTPGGVSSTSSIW